MNKQIKDIGFICLKRGLMFDNRLQLGGGASGINRYYPKEDPLDPKSADKEVTLKKLTGKNLVYNSISL